MAEHIEREKAIKIINENLGNAAIMAAMDGHPEEYFDGWADATSSAITGVESLPAADVRSERHGRWLYCGDGYECSECGGDSRVSSHPFCWRCGAKMDGKDGDTGEE